jgi:AP endonuclease-1
VEAEDPDILILTETKVSADCILFTRRGSQRLQVNNEPADPALTSRFPYRYWSISEKKTYCMSTSPGRLGSQLFIFLLAGTAILSKHKPISIDKTLPGHPDPNSVKGRIITLEFDEYYVIGTYVVNAGQSLKARSFVMSL